jgi:hypothetical protein
MGFIKEPEGVDFVIEPHAYTKEDMEIFDAHIQAYKKKMQAEVIKKVRNPTAGKASRKLTV